MTFANHMAEFQKSVVKVNTLTESNAIQYKLNFAGESSYSKPGYVYLNDSPYNSQTNGTGINVRVINPKTLALIDQKTFNIIPGGGTPNQAFQTYMRGIVLSNIAILTSGKALRSCPGVDAWFDEVGSGSWPGEFIMNNYEVAYSAIYSPITKRIVNEVYVASDGKANESSRAEGEVVFDTFMDFGATGMPNKAIFDPTVYKSTTDYEFKRWPNDAEVVSKLAEYKLKPSTKVLFSGELYASSALFTNGMTTRVNIRWFKGTTLLASESVEVASVDKDKFVKFERTIDIPATADGFTVVASRYPRKDAVVAEAQVRNIMLTQVTRPDTTSDDAGFGPNGIRTSNLNAVDGISPLVMVLPDSKSIANNIVQVPDIIELPLWYSDNP